MKSKYSWTHSSLRTKKVAAAGTGLFATKPLKKGTLLAVLGGHIMTLDEELKLPEELQDNAIQIDREFVIGVQKIEDMGTADFINHSCDPVAGIKGQISLVAMKNIKAGEQITFDYGTVLYKSGKRAYELACHCGSPRCRKVITSHDWKLPAIQKKYDGYFPYYIQEEILKKKR